MLDMICDWDVYCRLQALSDPYFSNAPDSCLPHELPKPATANITDAETVPESVDQDANAMKIEGKTADEEQPMKRIRK